MSIEFSFSNTPKSFYIIENTHCSLESDSGCSHIMEYYNTKVTSGRHKTGALKMVMPLGRHFVQHWAAFIGIILCTSAFVFKSQCANLLMYNLDHRLNM